MINKLLILLAFVGASVFIYTDGHRTENFHGDTLGYYIYLPATIIHGDMVHFTVVPDTAGIDPVILSHISAMESSHPHTENGLVVNQYTYGVALMELPFFLCAHLCAKTFGTHANGFSPIYEYALKASSLVYALLGLLLVYRILRRYVSRRIATLSVVTIFLGSNLYWFSCYQAGMSHVPLFFLYACMIWLSIRIQDQPRNGLFIAMGLVAGIITLIRPTDCIVLLIPLLYGVHSRETFLAKMRFIRAQASGILLMILFFVLPAIPQFLYWKAVSGHYFYYSYGEQGFNWSHPRIWDGLIGASNGWLTFTPLMSLALIGLLFYRKLRPWNWCLWILLPLYCYIIYSWYCFNYINGLGSRPMIHLYPLLAIPLAFFFDYISRRGLFVKSLVGIVTLFFVSLNMAFSYQQVWGILGSAESNATFNLSMLFRPRLGYNNLVIKDLGSWQPDTNKIRKVASLGLETFQDTVSGHYARRVSDSSNYVYVFGEEEYFDKGIKVSYRQEQFKDAKWIKCSGDFLYTHWPGYGKHMLVLSISRGETNILWKGCSIENKIGLLDGSCQHERVKLDHLELNAWGRVHFFIKIPKNIREGDILNLFAWNAPKTPLYVDNLALDLYK